MPVVQPQCTLSCLRNLETTGMESESSTGLHVAVRKDVITMYLCQNLLLTGSLASQAYVHL